MGFFLKGLPITRQQILDSSKLKEFADDNFKFDENEKVIQTGRKHCGKRRNCSLRVISPFPTVFSKGLFPRGVKRCQCVGMAFFEIKKVVVASVSPVTNIFKSHIPLSQ